MRILTIATIAAVLSVPALAQAQIKQPGAHTKYSVEIEPHFVFGWAGGPALYSNEGIGAGMRVSIPFLDNGPIPTINNSMGMTFGLDYLYYDFDNCFYGGVNINLCGPTYDYSAHSFWLPVAMQWNFFVHRRISVFGEAGLAISHTRFTFAQYCGIGPTGICEFSDSDTNVHPMFEGGARFMVADSVGFTLRLGWPHLTAGVSFLL